MTQQPRTPTDFDKVLGGLLRDRRESLNMNQRDCADVAGVSFQQLQKYEAGHNRMSVERFVLICKALSVEPPKVLQMGMDRHHFSAVLRKREETKENKGI